ncbi:MAG: hypothetical protein ACJ75J_14815 [Cytophagaceae bacterium]
MNHPQYFPLTEFLDELREKGLKIGVETLLDLKKILSSEHDIRTLKFLLCPLIAVTEEEQVIFYEVFDKHFSPAIPVQNKAADKSTTKKWKYKEQENKLQRQAFITIIVFLLLIGFTLFFIRFYIDSRKPAEEEFSIKLPESPKSSYPDEELTQTDIKLNPVRPHSSPARSVIQYKKFIDPDISYFQLSSPWWHENGFLFKCWIIVAIAAFFIGIELYLSYKNKLSSLKRKNKNPGPEKSLIIDEKIKIDLSEKFYSAAVKMRKRIESNVVEIDLPATVDATIRNKGMIDLRFSSRSKSSEFLVLIDKSQSLNQQMAWFEHLLGLLQKNDVHMDCFYYNSSMESLWKNSLSKPVNLNYLLYHYPDHRLIILGNGHNFIRKRELAPWTEILSNWEHRAILTYRSPSEWGDKEILLADRFILLKADINAFDDLMEHIETGKKTSVEDQSAGPELARLDMSRPLNDVIFDLKIAYDIPGSGKATLYSWIAGCCIYHSLSWDLTLYIGKLLSEPGNNLLTEENIEKLVSLSWFRRGKIPDSVRQHLLEEEKASQRQLMLVRKINELLIKNIPEDKTLLSYDHLMMSVIVTELMQNPEAGKKKDLIRKLRKYRENTRSNEVTAMAYLSKHSNPLLNKILGEKLKKMLFNEGLPYKGYKNYVRAVVAALLIGLPLAVFDLTLDYKEHKHFAYMSKSYCIDNPEKEACFRTHTSADIYNERPWALENSSADLYLTSALKADSSYIPAHLNRFIKNYNRALNFADRNASWYNPAVAVRLLMKNETYADEIKDMGEKELRGIRKKIKKSLSLGERGELHRQEEKIQGYIKSIAELESDNESALNDARVKARSL